MNGGVCKQQTTLFIMVLTQAALITANPYVGCPVVHEPVGLCANQWACELANVHTSQPMCI